MTDKVERVSKMCGTSTPFLTSLFAFVISSYIYAGFDFMNGDVMVKVFYICSLCGL